MRVGGGKREVKKEVRTLSERKLIPLHAVEKEEAQDKGEWRRKDTGRRRRASVVRDKKKEETEDTEERQCADGGATTAERKEDLRGTQQEVNGGWTS